jgi:zinc protease
MTRRYVPALMRVVQSVALVTAALATLLVTSAVAEGPPATRSTLSNGARLVISEGHSVPMVVIRVLVDAGARRDPGGKEGVAALTAEVLTEGTKTRSASQISEAVDFIGASLDASADMDSASVTISALSKDLPTAIGLLTDVLLHPTFPDVEVTRGREAALAAIRASEDEPGQVADRAFVQAVFRGEPYGHESIGTAKAVAKLTRADLVTFYKGFYRPERSIIAVAGDVDPTLVTDQLATALAEWAGGAPQFEYPTPSQETPHPVLIDKPITQANIVLGQRGVARDNPDFLTISVMNFILGGGGFTSRLLENIRTKAGLAYSVSSNFSSNKSPGVFEVVMQTKNQSANDAIQRACEQIESIRRAPVSDDELSGAKLYLTGSFPMRFDSNAKIVSFLSQVEFFGLGDDYADKYAERINAVTKDDVLRVAREYLHPDRLQLVVVGKLAEAKVPATAACGPSHP